MVCMRIWEWSIAAAASMGDASMLMLDLLQGDRLTVVLKRGAETNLKTAYKCTKKKAHKMDGSKHE